jgi:outer membrane lipoprotein-sorting protein
MDAKIMQNSWLRRPLGRDGASNTTRKSLLMGRKLALATLMALLLLPARALFAADDLEAVLRKLDRAAANFHSATADSKFDIETSDPVPDTEIQTGKVYYERKGADFKAAGHIATINNKRVVRIYTYSGGLLMLFDQATDQVTRIAKAGQYQSYLMLGFGASGKELADKFDIKYLGSELIDGVKTEKLELVAKDPDVRKNLAKVTIWVDPDRAVSLKQRFDQTPGVYRLCTYTNIRINESLPGDAFTFPTDKQTTYSNR